MEILEQSFDFDAQTTLPEVIIQTNLMVEFEESFMATHKLNGFLVGHGAARAGKTTCAQWLCDRINRAFTDSNPVAYRAIKYSAAKNKANNNDKQAMRTLYREVSNYMMDNYTFRNNNVEGLVSEVFKLLTKKRIGVIAVDEAGLLSVDAISAFAHLLDLAKERKYYLTVILIGMDNLPILLSEDTRPQLYGRVHDWIAFKDYELEDTHRFLAGFHEYFAGLNSEIFEEYDQIKVIHELSGGLPGYIVQFLARFDRYYRKIDVPVTSAFIKAIYFEKAIAYKESLSIATAGNGKKLLKMIKEVRRKK